jgi:zinc transporter, ZIP family
LLAGALGFSAGVMIDVSMVEIFVKAKDSLAIVYGEKTGYLWTTVAFFVGIALIAIIDRLVPDAENSHEIRNADAGAGPSRSSLMRMGLFSALAISITVAIAIHNIPEGIAVSMPIYYATGSRRKALIYSSLSGFAEPVGALIGGMVVMAASLVLFL